MIKSGMIWSISFHCVSRRERSPAAGADATLGLEEPEVLRTPSVQLASHWSNPSEQSASAHDFPSLKAAVDRDGLNQALIPLDP